MGTEDLIIDSIMRDQIYEDQIPYIVSAYEEMEKALSERYSPEFVKDHPEVAASLTVALELRSLAFTMGEQLENHRSGLVDTLHHLLDRDTNGTQLGQK